MLQKISLTAKQRKWVSVITAVWVLYTLGGYWLLPAAVRYKLPDIIREATGRDSSIAAVAFDPYGFSVRLQGFELKEKNGAPFVKFAEFYTDFNVWRSLGKGLFSFREVQLLQPYVHIGRGKDGVFDFSDLITGKPEKEEQKGGMLPFEIQNLRLINGDFRWQDAYSPQPVDATVQPFDLEINELITRQDRESGLSISLALKSGTKLDWTGNLALTPLHSEGRIHIQNLQTRQIWELCLQNQTFSLDKGVNELDMQYRFDFNGGKLHTELAPLQIMADGFAMTEAGDTVPLVELKTLALRDAKLDVQWQQADGQLQVKVPQGALEIKKFALTDPGAQKQRLDIEEFALQGLNVDILQQDVLQLKVAHQKIEVKNSSFALEAEHPLKITAAGITVGPVQFSAQQSAPHGALEMTAIQDSLNLQNFSLSLPATRETLLDVAETAIGKLRFTLQPRENAAPEIQVTQEEFDARQIVLRDSAQKEPLVKIASASMGEVQFDLEKKLVKVASASSSGASIRAWLDKKGMLNYQELFVGKGTAAAPVKQAAQAAAASTKRGESAARKAPAPASAEPPPATEQWTVTVDKLALADGAVAFQDRSGKIPAEFKLSAIESGVENFSTAGKAKIPLHVSALFNDKGKIKLKGSAALQPFSSAIDIDVAQFPLQPFQPYTDRFVRLDILSGALQIDGKLTMDMIDPNKPRLSFKGGTGISRLHIRDQLESKDFAKWEEFALRGVAFDLQPLRFKAAEVLVDRPYLRVAIDKERNTNFGAIVVKPPQTAAQATGRSASPETKKKPAAAAKTPELSFDVGRVKVRQGSSDFSDLSLIIPFEGTLNDLNGLLGGLSSRPDDEATLILQGELFDLAPVDIHGTFNPYQTEGKISLDFRNMPLPTVTPYMAEFAGYKIEKGQMTLNLDYQIAHGQLQADNKILIDQLTLGEKVDSPRAVSLPISLAIALLKDRQGKINIDFPITGSLEDPQFSIGKLVVDAMLNIITKVVTSPFRALAALAGSKDEDIGRIDFEPGSAVLAKTETDKLDDVAKVFAERKVLNLEIKGVAYQKEDWPKLSDDALLDRLREMRRKELGKKAALADIELSENEYKQLLADLFIAEFPQLGKRSLFGTPELIGDGEHDFYDVAKQKLRAKIPPDPQRLRALAAERGQAIARYLLQKKGLDARRVFILDPKVEPQAGEHGVTLELMLRGS